MGVCVGVWGFGGGLGGSEEGLRLPRQLMGNHYGCWRAASRSVSMATAQAPSILAKMMFEKRPVLCEAGLPANGTFDWRHA